MVAFECEDDRPQADSVCCDLEASCCLVSDTDDIWSRFGASCVGKMAIESKQGLGTDGTEWDGRSVTALDDER